MEKTHPSFLFISETPHKKNNDYLKNIYSRANKIFNNLFSIDLNNYIQYHNEDNILYYGGNFPDSWIDKKHNEYYLSLVKGAYLSSDGTCVAGLTAFKFLVENKRESLSEIAPPFGAIMFSRKLGYTFVSTDYIGLKQLFYYYNDSFCAVSSSLQILGFVLNTKLNYESIAEIALVGHCLDGHSPLKDIKLLKSGECLEIYRGILKKNSYLKHNINQCQFSDFENAAQIGAEIIKTQVKKCIANYNKLSLELSGGFDSRMLLAALDKSDINKTNAVTLGTANNDDVKISNILSGKRNLYHKIVYIENIIKEPFIDTLKKVYSYSRNRNFSVNIIDGVVLSLAEEKFPQYPRLGGQNGEFARGFYYVGQKNMQKTNEKIINNLINWRIIMNECIDINLFKKDFLKKGKAATTSIINSIFSEYNENWLTSTDLFYLFERMRGWAGPIYSGASQERVVLSPFFHYEFVDWALKVPPRFKKDSMIWSRIIEILSPEMATIYTTKGVKPKDLLNLPIRSKILLTSIFLKKAVFKIAQRVNILTKEFNYSKGITKSMLEQIKNQREPLKRMYDLGFISHETKKKIFEDKIRLGSNSVGFIQQIYWLDESIKNIRYNHSRPK
ncbi:MAG: hypothetical protein ACOCUV_00490 [bacterium]